MERLTLRVFFFPPVGCIVSLSLSSINSRSDSPFSCLVIDGPVSALRPLFVLEVDEVIDASIQRSCKEFYTDFYLALRKILNNRSNEKGRLYTRLRYKRGTMKRLLKIQV